MKKNRKKRMGLVRLCICTMGLLIGNGNLSASRAYSLPSVPDSAYLFSYMTKKNSNHSELYFAWSLDTVNWQGIGPEYGFLFCDYGRWGNEKRMLDLYLYRATDGIWHCLGRVNEREAVVTHAASNIHPRFVRFPASLPAYSFTVIYIKTSER